MSVMRHAAALAGMLLAVACSAPNPSLTPSPSPSPSPTPSPVLTPHPTATLPAPTAVAPSPSATATPAQTATPRPTVAPLVDQPLSDGAVAALQAVLDEYVTRNLAPSLSAAVIVPGVGVWSGAAGQRDTAADLPATTDTAYTLASITKTFVSALTLRLAEDGLLSIDDPAANWLDATAASKTNGATIRQLLGMRSGIADYENNPALSDMTHASWTAAELVDLIGPPDFAAGAQYEYTNSNYLLLGLIDERAGGRPINELLHSYLWDPLGLDRTYYAGPETIPEPLAHGYNLGPNGPVDLYDGSGILPSALEASAARTAGAVASTASDVARWMFLLYSGQVLSPSSQQQLLDFGQTPTYGLGVMRTVLEDAGLALGHEGQMPGYRTAGYFIRDTGVVLVVLTNQTDFDTAGILGRLLGALPG